VVSTGVFPQPWNKPFIGMVSINNMVIAYGLPVGTVTVINPVTGLEEAVFTGAEAANTFSWATATADRLYRIEYSNRCVGLEYADSSGCNDGSTGDFTGGVYGNVGKCLFGNAQ
jgi:hypothetical protein